MANNKKGKSTAQTKKKSSTKKSSTKAVANKSSAKKKTESKYVGKKKRNSDISFFEEYYNAFMLLYIFGALLLMAIALIKGENFWMTLRSSMFAFFGAGFYALIAGMFVIGIRLALHNLKRSFLVTNLTGLVCVGCISGFFHLMNYSTLIGDFTEWKNQLVDAAKVSFAVPGFKPYGGVIGAIFGGAPLHGFGKIGATVTLLVAFLVCLYFYLNVDRNTFGDAVSKTINDSKDKLTDTNEQLKIRNEERRKIRSEEKATRMALAAEKARELAEKEQSSSNDAFDFNETKIENDPDRFAEDTSKVTYRVGDKVFTYPANFSPKQNEKPVRNTTKAASGGFISSGSKPPVNIFADKKKVEEPEVKPDVSLHHETPVQEIDFGDFTEIVTDEAELSEDASAIVKDAIATAKANRQKNIDEVKNYVEKDKKAEYKLPPVDCLNAPKFENNADFTDEMQATAKKLVDVLMSFGVETRLIGASRGPSVTRYELSPAPGVKISKITNLSDDIALGLASTGVRIEAPIPNKAAVGIEVPNRSRSTVTFREMISSKEFMNNGGKLLNVALGKDIAGNICCADLSKMPHLLIAGTTGSGKSVCLNGMIASILYNATPEQVKLLMIDPKQVEFTVYNGIPHLLVPVITDARKAAGSLAWAVGEMENRYKAFTQFGVRDISSFNKYAEKHPEIDFMPQIVLFIDELNDLMMVSPKEVEDSICRLAQKARAAGMHLVVATQRPSVDVITGIIKANIPSRISLSVSSQVDSRTILDSIGAEKLLGNGDMLFAPVGVTKPVRIQGAYLSDEEIGNIVSYIKNQVNAEYDDEIMQEIEKNAVAETAKKKGAAEIQEDSDGQYDSLIDEALNIITQLDTASTTVLQRKLRVGYARAARIVDELEELGYISSPTGNNKARNVLITRNQYLEMKAGATQSAEDFDVLSD